MGVGSEARGEERVDLSEILKEKLYFAPLQRVEDTSAVVQCLPKRTVSFHIDSELVCVSFSLPRPSCSLLLTICY
jgi:hypothetical protein